MDMDILAINNKSRGRVRGRTGAGYSVFSMGALAVALGACGGDFKLADDGVKVDGTALKLTYTETPKSPEKSKIMATYGSGSAEAVSAATVSDKTLTVTLKEGDDIKVEIKDGGLKDNNDKAFTATYYVDNKAPTLVSAELVDGKVVATFSENLGSAVAAKFELDGVAATSATVNGKKVTLNFDKVGKLTLDKGAVKDDGKVTIGTDVDKPANNPANENVADADGKTVTGGTPSDTTAPTLKAGGDALSIDKDAKTFTITFSEEVTGTETNGAFDTSKFTITGLTVSSVASATDKKMVVVTVSGGTIAAGNYKVAIAADAIVDMAGNKFAADDTEEDTVSSVDDDGLVGLSYVSDADYGF